MPGTMARKPARNLRVLLAGLPGWIWPGLGIVLMWLGIGLHLAHERSEALRDARTNGANLASAFRESMLRTIHEIDQTLLFVRALHLREGRQLDLRPWVDGAGPEMRLALQIATTDRNGLMTLSNLRPITERIDLSDRPHFRHFADQPPDAPLRDHLFVSAPVLGRVSKAWTIQFVRMLKTPTGAFDGMVVLSVAPGYLTRFYAAVDVGRHGTVSLIGLDRTIRARAGPGTAPIGEISASPAIAAAEKANEGSFEWIDPADNTARIENFARVPGYPLVVTVGLARDEVLANFRESAVAVAIIGAFLTVLLALLGWAIRHGQRALASARATTQVAIENIGQGIIMVDASGTIVLLNQRAAGLLQLPPRFGPGARFADMIAWQRDQGEFTSGVSESVRRHLNESARPDRALPEIYKRQRPNGTWLEIRAIPLPHDGILFSVRDITEWETTQAALVAARDAAEDASRARAQFLAVMSHEIRTPLNGILGVAELLADIAHEPEQARFVAVIRQSGQHLLDLLNDILDFSKIDQQGIELESLPFDPAQVLRGAVEMVASRAAEQGLDLECHLDPGLPIRVMGDAYRLRQVLLNLLGNAVKFTRAGRIEARLAATPAPGGWNLSFAVTDTGIGIAPEMLPQLFQEFTQMDGSITRRFGGSGLGLAISRRLVQAMGGTIAVESTPGRGSAFSFTIRAAEAPAELVGQPEGHGAEAVIARHRPTVLLAEDNRVNRLVATRMAERLGCRVAAVADGRAAVAAVQEGGYDLVLMDVMMPEMDGLAATRAIRALPGPEARIPIIGLSANAFRSDEAEALAAGMDGFVTKPVTLHQLAEAMARTIAEPPPAPPSAIPPVPPALAALAETLGAETAALIARAFTEEAPTQLAHLRALAAAADSLGLAREAHALAGSAGTVGLDALATALRTIERAVRSGAPLDPAAVDAPPPLVQGGPDPLSPPPPPPAPPAQAA